MFSENIKRWSDKWSVRREAYAWLYGVGTALLITAALLFWNVTSVNPERTFQSMLAQSLTVPGVSSQVTETSQGTTVQQTVQYAVGTGNVAHGLTILTQGKTTIKTELVGNPTKTFTRYLAISTDQKTKDGKVFDAKSVLGVWAAGQTTDSSANASPLLSQAVLGFGSPVGSIPVAIGNLTTAQRSSLLQQITDTAVYQVDYSKVTKTHADGHLLYSYPVSIQPIPYLNMLKTFAADVGMHDLDKLDANSYAGTAALNLTLTVDAHAHQLVGVSDASGYKISYSGYGIVPHVALPTTSISSSALQQKLTNL